MVSYPCDQCKYVTSTQLILKVHKKSKHEGIKYPCDQCDYAATTSSHLKTHQEARHAGIRYPCDKCEYAASALQSLNRHKKLKHKVNEEGDKKIKGNGSSTKFIPEVCCQLLVYHILFKPILYDICNLFSYMNKTHAIYLFQLVHVKVEETVVKEELMEQDPLEFVETSMEMEKIEDEVITVKEEYEQEVCDL